MIKGLNLERTVVTTSSSVNPELISALSNLSTDQKLGLFWFVYKEVGKSITLAAPGSANTSSTIAEDLIKQVSEMAHDQQLQIQRDLVEGNNNLISREYGAFSDTTKLLFWYLLAQGMYQTVIVPMPDGYTLDPQAAECLLQIQQLTYSEQMSVLRGFVGDMGVDPNTSAHDKNTGL